MNLSSLLLKLSMLLAITSWQRTLFNYLLSKEVFPFCCSEPVSQQFHSMPLISTIVEERKSSLYLLSLPIFCILFFCLWRVEEKVEWEGTRERAYWVVTCQVLILMCVYVWQSFKKKIITNYPWRWGSHYSCKSIELPNTNWEIPGCCRGL